MGLWVVGAVPGVNRGRFFLCEGGLRRNSTWLDHMIPNPFDHFGIWYSVVYKSNHQENSGQHILDFPFLLIPQS